MSYSKQAVNQPSNCSYPLSAQRREGRRAKPRRGESTGSRSALGIVGVQPAGPQRSGAPQSPGRFEGLSAGCGNAQISSLPIPELSFQYNLISFPERLFQNDIMFAEQLFQIAN